MIKIIYYPNDNFIMYDREGMSVECILKSYDDIVKLLDFDNGLLTVLMKKENREIEEYVDFESALSDIHQNKEKSKYFSGISIDDMVIERA